MFFLKTVIFLDIEGVLITYSGIKRNVSKKEERYNTIFDENPCEILIKIITASDERVDIVITDSWRINPNNMEVIKKEFIKNGINLKFLKGCTDNLAEHDRSDRIKEKEIDKWLNEKYDKKELIFYVILDDSPESFKNKVSRLIECDPEYGLTDESFISFMKMKESFLRNLKSKEVGDNFASID